MSAPRLADLTTLRVGGPPDDYLAPETEDELVAAARGLLGSGHPFVVLAGGSNTVAPDAGVNATLLHVVTRGVKQVESDDGLVHLRVQAGEPWDDVVRLAVENGWAGIEALAGIPGSTGAVPVQNVGAYGVEVSSVLAGVEVLDGDTLELRRLVPAELGLGYRTSVFKRGYEGLIVAVELALAPGGTATIGYDQLAAALNTTVGTDAPISAVRDAVLALRRSKGMVLDDADHDTWSAGSFFTNPVVTASVARRLPDDAPRWPVADQPDEGPLLTKLSAAWLIERAGITRGFALPGSGAGVSTKHTLAITNRGAATAADVLQLAGFVRDRVAADFGIVLQPEPVIL